MCIRKSSRSFREAGLWKDFVCSSSLKKRTRPAFYGSVGVGRSKRRFFPFAEVQPGVCHFGPWELDITPKNYTFLQCKKASPSIQEERLSLSYEQPQPVPQLPLCLLCTSAPVSPISTSPPVDNKISSVTVLEMVLATSCSKSFTYVWED